MEGAYQYDGMDDVGGECAVLKVIRQVLQLSGDLKGRLYGSFVCSFLNAMMGMLPLAAVFYFLSEAELGHGMRRQTWLVIFGILAVVFGRQNYFSISHLPPAKYRWF